MRRRAALSWLLLGAVVVLATALLSLTIGILPVAPTTVAADLLAACGIGEPSPAATVVVHLRLPRAAGAVCVGACLGTAGGMLQALLRNPMASPAVVGTAQAASFGAVLAILFGLGHLGTLACAFAASLVAVWLVLSMARTRTALPVEAVVLTGMAVGLLFTALTMLVRQLTRDEYAIGRMGLWASGGLWNVTWEQLAWLSPGCALALLAAVLGARHLDLLALGEADAHRLGLPVARAGTTALLLSCVLTSLAVCIGGMVAFVGLIVPHLARRLVGPAHRVLLPCCAALGAVVLVATDTVARTAVPPQELPLTVVTSLVGVPCFLLLLRAQRRRGGAW